MILEEVEEKYIGKKVILTRKYKEEVYPDDEGLFIVESIRYSHGYNDFYFRLKGTNAMPFIPEAKNPQCKLVNEEIMKPQRFKIEGKKHLISAISVDLKQMGYSIVQKDTSEGICLVTNAVSDLTQENYKELYDSIFNGEVLTEVTIRFVLPQDYLAALDYAKDALDDKYWKQEFKLFGIYPVVKSKEFDEGVVINKEEFPALFLNTVRSALSINAVKSINVGCNGQYKLTLNDIDNLIKIAQSS